MIGTIASGQVVRHFGSRGAFVMTENITIADGRSWDVEYTIWNDGPAPAVGDIITVTGEVSVSKKEYPAPSGMKTAVNINFNEPKIQVLGHPAPAPADESLPF